MTKLNDIQSILLSTAGRRDNGSAYPLPDTLANADDCGSACKKDPLSGVIGVQQGPLISMV